MKKIINWFIEPYQIVKLEIRYLAKIKKRTKQPQKRKLIEYINCKFLTQ